MTPRKKKDVKLEQNRTFAPTDPLHEDQYADTDKGGSDKGESTQNQAEPDDKQTPAKPKAITNSPKVPKKPEEIAAGEARKARTMAATEANRQLLSDRFVWKDGKPEPFEQLRKQMKLQWERSEKESHCDFVERMHKNWKKLELEKRHELKRIQGFRSHRSFDHDKEVNYVEFEWEGRNVRCETFLKVDLSDPKDIFKSSGIFENFNKKMASYDKAMSQERKIRAKHVQLIVAKNAPDTKLNLDPNAKPKPETEPKPKSEKTMKDIITEAYEEMDSLNRNEWENRIADAERALRGEKVDGYPEGKYKYKKRYSVVTDKWESWGSGGREWTKDKKMINDRNLFASDPKNNILRRPSVNGDTNAIYMAFDRNSKLMILLDPHGIPWSYDEAIHKRMKEDAHEFYSQVKRPNPKSNKRHISQREHLKENPELEPWWCGSDHYGHWHAQQHYQSPMLETSDVHELNATERQLLLQFLRYTGGPMTRVLDFWFGVWEPDLRQRYRDIYAKSPEFARLPPVNADHPDTYCLRVAVCNRPTDEHRDQSDIRGGLTGLVHLGDFKGAAMCINQLGIALDGYGDGAVFLFRGTELRHYISQWSGKYRYAFDHTTHQSVEDAVIRHEETGRWGSKKDPEQESEESKPAKEPNAARKSEKANDKDDKKPDNGDAPAKPQRKRMKRSRDEEDDEEERTEKPALKKTRKRSPNDEGEECTEKPAPKKSKATLPVRTPRQTRKKK